MKQTQKIPFSAPDFFLIGIASHENDYRLAWAINSSLNFQLTKSPDITIFHDKYKSDITLSVFSNESSQQNLLIKLFANRGDNFVLLEEYRNMDYFLKIEGETAAAKLPAIIQSLKAIEIIMGVYPIEIQTIKKIQRIIF